MKEFDNIQTLIEEEKFLDAEKKLIELIKQNDKDFYSHQLLRIVYKKKNDLQKSIYHFLKVIEFQSNYKEAYLNIINIYENTNQVFEANKYYLKGLSIFKDDLELNRNYSKFLIRVGEVTKGLSYQYKYLGIVRFEKSGVKII